MGDYMDVGDLDEYHDDDDDVSAIYNQGPYDPYDSDNDNGNYDGKGDNGGHNGGCSGGDGDGAEIGGKSMEIVDHTRGDVKKHNNVQDSHGDCEPRSSEREASASEDESNGEKAKKPGRKIAEKRKTPANRNVSAKEGNKLKRTSINTTIARSRRSARNRKNGV
jgi:hypothetical protein